MTNRRMFVFLLCLLSLPWVARAQDEKPKHYLTFQFSYQGTASKAAADAFGRSESHLAVTNQFSGRSNSCNSSRTHSS